ncbi:THO complex subunit 4B-like [Rutidosis leptorrhynchoides]|uniref:THO complex subunit 4B-like n=1 Tax=Rutidosis leptorrhynchoides TaxID=125765 RepID=UPI003A9A6168
MTEGLDMSLDDIIKNNKKSGRSDTNTTFRPGGRGHGRSGGLGSVSASGPTRRSDNRAMSRPIPYFVPQVYHVQEMLVGDQGNSEAGTKLYVSNLNYQVTNEDIKVLFSEVGELKRYAIHYDRSGRSKGTAEVVFVRQSDAVVAMRRYNNVQLDGQPMQLELVGVKIVTPVPIAPMQKDITGNNPTNISRSGRGRNVGRGKERGGNGSCGYAKDQGRVRPQNASVEDLDADLEKYRLEAMHIN